MKKGISTVVASVLLVAAAIIIGVVATTWASGFVGQKTASAGSAGCATSTAFTVSDVEVNNATTRNDTSNMTARLTNVGQDDLKNFTVEWEFGNGTIVSFVANSPGQNDNITAGQSVQLQSKVNTSENSAKTVLKSMTVTAGSCKAYRVTVTGSEITQR